MDSIGFTVRYQNQLLPIGSPDAEPGTKLVGKDSKGHIECELEYDKENHAFYRFGRVIDRGTSLTYKINFKDTKVVHSKRLIIDNRLGVYNALKSCRDVEGWCDCLQLRGKNMAEALCLTSPNTCTSNGVCGRRSSPISPGYQMALSPAKALPFPCATKIFRERKLSNRIIEVAQKKKMEFQLEVEGMGSSDGRELQISPYPFDWCFVGAPQQHAHTPHEKVHKADILNP
jgi:hypothetical protein